ncbi:winged helix-turn-helix domain-containing protein [Gordonia sp. VNK1]|uniref:winged helix-turn-helix domain-containing protein n=1 Tax=Gordonia oleivorans TaxID=3156618 RepID=UPI0032B4D67C
MNASVSALLDLLDDVATVESQSDVDHLLGQVSAEVLASSPTIDDIQKIAARAQLHRSHVGPLSEQRRAALGVIAGLFHAWQAQRAAGADESQQSVKERLLFELSEGPAGPTELSERIGSPVAVTSRGLSALRGQGLVHHVNTPDPTDRRRRIYALTPLGETFVMDRLGGDYSSQLADTVGEAMAEGSHPEEELRNLLTVMKRTGPRDPMTACALAPTVDRLRRLVKDARLQAEAIGELSVVARTTEGCFSRDDLRLWYEELSDLAAVHPSIEARALYDRGRWRMMYEDPESAASTAAEDFRAAIRVASSCDDTDDRHHRIGWCEYQLAMIELHSGDPANAVEGAERAREAFSAIDNERWDPRQGEVASMILRARAHAALGDDEIKVARRLLEDIIPVADEHGYVRQMADARFHLGKLEAGDDHELAIENLHSAAKRFVAAGNSDRAALAAAAGSSVRFASTERSTFDAELFRRELDSVAKRLNDPGQGAYPSAHYWQQGTVWHSLAVLAVDTGHESEAMSAWKNAFDSFGKARSVRHQARVLAAMWRRIGRSGTPSTQDLHDLAHRVGIGRLDSEVMAAALADITEIAMHGPELPAPNTDEIITSLLRL